jgi:hypothetical protein
MVGSVPGQGGEHGGHGTDLYWPGWRVTVDGTERSIHRANGLFRGVAIDAGRDTVRFGYDPRAVRLGAVVSGLTALLLAGILAADRFVRRRRTLDPAQGAREERPMMRRAGA